MRIKVSKREVVFALEKVCGKRKYNISSSGKIDFSNFNSTLKLFVKQLYEGGILSENDLLILAARDQAIRNLCVKLGLMASSINS